MSYSSILGVDQAPVFPSGRSSELLGPSDNSDSGSDALGTGEIHGDSDAAGTGERGVVSGIDAKEGGDILPDRVVRIGGPDGMPEADADDGTFTDLDDSGLPDEAVDAAPDDSGADTAREVERDRRSRPVPLRETGPDEPAREDPAEGGPGLRR